MKWIIGLAFILLSNVVAAKHCVMFSGLSYCEAWRVSDDSIEIVKFLPQHQTLQSWTQMISVRKYFDKSALVQVVPTYVAAVKPMLAMQPDVIYPKNSVNKEDVSFRLLLLDSAQTFYEYTIARFYRDNDRAVKGVFYTYRLPFSKQMDFSPMKQHKDVWLQQIQQQTIDRFIQEKP